MSFREGDHVEFEDIDNHVAAGVTRGRALLEYTPPYNLGCRSRDTVLVRVDEGYGGWSGGDGYYYWYAKVSTLRLIGRAHQLKRPISPIFYEVRQ